MYEFLFIVVSALAVVLALILALKDTGMTEPLDGQQDAGMQEPIPLGDKAGSALLTVFQDLYRQEIAAEEDVHRSLPFFATALGLFIPALGLVAAQLPDWAGILKTCATNHPQATSEVLLCGWPAEMAALLLLASWCCIVLVLWYLLRAALGRNYERIGPEFRYMVRARQMRDHYIGLGNVPNDEVDAQVSLYIRAEISEDIIAILPHNREISRRRYNYRARAFGFLLGGLFLALVATIFITVMVKAGFLPAKGIFA